MTQHNNMLIDRYFKELLNDADFGKAREIVTPDFIFYGPSAPQGRTLQGLAQFISELKTGFSDKHFEEIERIVDGDRIASRFRMTGTHDGIFHGIPPTERLSDVEGCDIFYIRNDKIAEVRAYFDFMVLLRQVGAISSRT
jgi:steroid delta-isomerase-like uncharacterized protein